MLDRNINLFPFRITGITVTLRTAYPLADEHCQGTLAPSAIKIHTLLCCYYYQDPHSCKIHWNSHPSFKSNRTPIYEIIYKSICSLVSVADLTPSILDAINLDG